MNKEQRKNVFTLKPGIKIVGAAFLLQRESSSVDFYGVI